MTIQNKKADFYHNKGKTKENSDFTTIFMQKSL